MLETLDQDQDPRAKAEKTKWRPVLVQKPATRGHGNLNIMEKAASYKMKQNLEIPKTFKGKSFTNTDHNILFEKMSKIDLCIGGMRG